MKRTIKLALSASLLLGATSAFATNGDVMIGQGAKARSMGGVGIAKAFGAESALANPAMIKSVKDMEFTMAVTYFDPSVAFSSNTGANTQQTMGANGFTGYNANGTPAGTAGTAVGDNDYTKATTGGTSAAATSSDSGVAASIIPEMSFAHRLSDNFVYGLSVNGVAGMGTDYKGNTTNGAFGIATSLSILKVSVPLAYSNSGFTLGLAPVLQYGTLQMNYETPFGRSNNPESSDTSYGYEIGAAYDFEDGMAKGLSLGAVYKSKIAMEYKNNIGKAMSDFGVQSVTSGDKLDQPAEIGMGLAYEISGNTIALDYKQIKWADAAGYADFGWEDQNIYALGYEFAAKSWALRLGYNYGKSPIKEQNGAKTGVPGTAAQPGQNYDGAAINFFNLAGFPGIVEQHFTLGAGYSLTKSLDLDAAFVYAPEVSQSFDTSAMTEGQTYQSLGGGQTGTGPFDPMAGSVAANTPTSTANVTHSQMGITLAMTYRF